MKYSVAFKGLPFEPEKRQVIYVENLYDERINAIIREIYEQLKWTFKRANLDFIYLPMFFNDEETKEKILYYAPYLTSEIIENAELRNNYLLSYMSNLGNRDKIGPSLIYAPQKEDDEWIFQGQSIDLDEKNRYSFLRLIEDFIADMEEDIESSRQRLHVMLDDEDSDDGILYRSDEDGYHAVLEEAQRIHSVAWYISMITDEYISLDEELQELEKQREFDGNLYTFN